MIKPGQVSRSGNIQLLTAKSQLAQYRKIAEDHLKQLKDIEMRLSSIGDDAQLASVDLQSVLQKQQQSLQMMSTISKAIHDTALSVIRKIAG